MRDRRDPSGPAYLGYHGRDHDAPFAHYFQREMAPLADGVVRTLNLGAQAPELFASLADAPSMLDAGSGPAETGYALGRDGEIRVAVLTPMPGVSPEMWDWWFAWHGSDSRRYKLWHPRAHLRVGWADEAGDGEGASSAARGYVGRTSFVDEYIGSTLTRASIRFVPPVELGFDTAALTDASVQTVVCARIGPRLQSVDVGYLVHHVRRTAEGSEMRSRFWLGGGHIGARTRTPVVTMLLPRMARIVFKPTVRAASELLVHCAQEMAHLAGFLPKIHEEFAES